MHSNYCLDSCEVAKDQESPLNSRSLSTYVCTDLYIVMYTLVPYFADYIGCLLSTYNPF
jgi:hypothetical protein